MKDLEMINNQPTFENCPEWTYWKNKKTGTIVNLGLFRKYNPRKEHLDVSTINTRYELTYYYSWDEIVEKFDYLGTNDNWSEEEYKSVLTNKQLYWEYRHALKNIPRVKRWVKTTDVSWAQDRLDNLLTMKTNFETNFK